MKTRTIDEKTKKELLAAQRNEITESLVYEKLSRSIRDPRNSKILKKISEEEKSHHDSWKKHTEEDVKPHKLRMWKYILISRLFGITFGLKLMERGEEKAQTNYKKLAKFAPIARRIEKDEVEHEKQLLGMIDEDRLKYTTSMFYGLSDALVELTGALAGLTLVFQSTTLIALAGFITGVAAAMSMCASQYLAVKLEKGQRSPRKAAAYTGAAYILTVLFLIYPYVIFASPYLALLLTVINAVMIIFIFTFYISVTQDIPLKSRFLEMLTISLGVAGLAFLIGFLARQLLNL
jgi:VIT1/CCC1 family predicted Fe2+/Mn2+ transporter